MAQASKKTTTTTTMIKRAGSIFVGTEKKYMKKSSFFSSISMIVPLITILIDFLEKKGKDIEGIFRVSGSISAVQALKEELTTRSPLEVLPSDDWDPHVVAGLLKLLLRELEEPLLTFLAYEPLLMSIEAKMEKDQLEAIMIIVDSIPQDNKFILGKLLDLFSKIDGAGQTSKMSSHNLAVVMGPTILRPSGESFETMMTDSPKVVEVVNVMIKNVAVFPKWVASSPPVPQEQLSPCSSEPTDEIVRHRSSQAIDKRSDWKKKYTDLKKNYDEIVVLYEDMKLQNFQMENKIMDFEEILDMLENSKSEVTSPKDESNLSSDEDTIVKLKLENDRLKELLIKVTREEVSNFKEEQSKKPKDSFVMFNLKEKLSDSIAALSEADNNNNEKKRTSFIKRQNSSKKILKGKITKDEVIITNNSGTLPHKREHSSSVNHRSLTRKDVESIVNGTATAQDVKLPPLNSLHESKAGFDLEKNDRANTPKNDYGTLRLPRLSLSRQSDDSKIPLSARFEKLQHQTTFGPSPQHKTLTRNPTVNCSSPKWTDSNNENIPPVIDSKEVKDGNAVPTPRSKANLNEVVSRFHEFERKVVIREKAHENELSDIKKQMDDMKSSIDTLVSAFNQFSHKVTST